MNTSPRKYWYKDNDTGLIPSSSRPAAQRYQTHLFGNSQGGFFGRRGESRGGGNDGWERTMPEPRVPRFRVPAALVSPASLFLVGGIVYYFSLDKPSEDELNSNISKEFPDVRFSLRGCRWLVGLGLPPIFGARAWPADHSVAAFVRGGFCGWAAFFTRSHVYSYNSARTSELGSQEIEPGKMQDIRT